MRFRLAIAALAAATIFAAYQPAACAQTVYSTTDGAGGITQDLVTTNDRIQVRLSGKDWATARFTVAVAGSGGITTQVSIDGGVNWLPAPYAKRLDQVSANPSVAPWSNNGPVAGVFEVPLPANATHFSILYQTGGTKTTVTIAGGTPYVPRIPVVAVLYDTTSAANTALDTGILDTSGWAGFTATYVTPAGGSGAIKGVDDAGAATSLVTVPASATATGVFSPAGGTGTALGTAGSGSFAWRARRAQLTSAAVAALTSRIRIEAWR